MRSILTALLLTFSAPALANDCQYVAADTSVIEFIDNGENDVLYRHADGTEETCYWARSDEGTGTRIYCDEFDDFITDIGPADDERAEIRFNSVSFRRVCN